MFIRLIVEIQETDYTFQYQTSKPNLKKLKKKKTRQVLDEFLEKRPKILLFFSCPQA